MKVIKLNEAWYDTKMSLQEIEESNDIELLRSTRKQIQGKITRVKATLYSGEGEERDLKWALRDFEEKLKAIKTRLNELKKSSVNESIAYSEETIDSMVAQLKKNIEDYKILMADFPEDSDYWQEMINKCQAEINEYSSYELLDESVINEDMSEEDYDEFFSIVDEIGPAINAAGGDMDDINGNLSHPYEDEDRIRIVFVSTVDKKDAKKFVKTVEAEIEKALQTTRFNRVRDIYVYQLSGNDLQMRIPDSLRSEFSQKFRMFEIDIRASSDFESKQEEFWYRSLREDANVFVWDGKSRVPEDVEYVKIADGVTNISDRAFFWCENLKSVTIPNSVTTIGDRAFRYCTDLTSVTIPGSVKTIGKGAFSHCEGLTSVTIPDSVTTIDDYAFSDCYDLTSVKIGNSVTTIGDWAFHYCYYLKSITIPDSVATIGDYAFNSCERLTSITIPDSVTSIGKNAFLGCPGVEEKESIINESANEDDRVELEYDRLDITIQEQTYSGDYENPPEYDEFEMTVDYTFYASKDAVIEELCQLVTDDTSDEEYEAHEDDWDNYVEKIVLNNFDSLVEKYMKKLLDRFEDEARAEAEEEYN